MSIYWMIGCKAHKECVCFYEYPKSDPEKSSFILQNHMEECMLADFMIEHDECKMSIFSEHDNEYDDFKYHTRDRYKFKHILFI